MRHFMYVPFTGLGLYGGFRGNRWLRNRIKVFTQFVVPSLQAQTSQNFTIWVSWRREEKNNKQVRALEKHLERIFGADRVAFTYGGCCFWDDKYPDDQAHERLIESLHRNLGEIIDYVGDHEKVLMTIQPSDDCYHKGMVEEIQSNLSSNKIDAVGYTKGYMINYFTGQVVEYNPETNPPFFTIKFDKATFIDPLKHAKHTGPYKSHEYVGDHLMYRKIDKRGFMVGTHQDNISTVFDHPYAGDEVDGETLKDFGLYSVNILRVDPSLRRWVFHKFPYGVKRKLRYWAERDWMFRPIFSFIYNFMRS